MATKRFEAQLGLNTKEFDSKLRGASGNMGAFGKAMSRVGAQIAAAFSIVVLKRFVQGAVEAAKETGNLSDKAQGTVTQLGHLSDTFDEIKENIGMAILESDKFRNSLTKLEKLINNLRERGLLSTLFESREEWEKNQAEKAKWDTDRFGNPLVKTEEKRILTLGKLNEQLKKEKGNLQDINIEDTKAILIQANKIKGIEAQIKAIENLYKEQKKSISYGQGLAGITPPSNSSIPATFGLHGGTLARAPEQIEKITESLDIQMQAVNELTSVFADMFMSIDQGFEGMVESLIASLKRLVAELLAKAAVLALLNIIAPGSGLAVAAHKALTGGGLGSLFAGNRMVGNLSPSSVTVGGQFRIRGRDLELALRRNGMGY